MTIESFAKVIDDPRIDDIAIMDDGSAPSVKDKFYAFVLGNKNRPGKVRFIEQSVNLGMSLNKRDAISRAKNEWCIIFDSDNIIGPDYLDAFFEYVGPTGPVGDRSIFCPDFAKPKFNYTKYSNEEMPSYHHLNIQEYIINDDFNCLMNTCNYIVNRDFYLQTYQHNAEHVASDTIWHNYNHLKAGGSFHVVPGMQYEHRVHPGSGFMQNAEYNIKQAEKVRKLIQQL